MDRRIAVGEQAGLRQEQGSRTGARYRRPGRITLPQPGQLLWEAILERLVRRPKIIRHTDDIRRWTLAQPELRLDPDSIGRRKSILSRGDNIRVQSLLALDAG